MLKILAPNLFTNTNTLIASITKRVVDQHCERVEYVNQCFTPDALLLIENSRTRKGGLLLDILPWVVSGMGNILLKPSK